MLRYDKSMIIRIASFLHRFGLTIVEVALGVSFIWFGLLLVNGATPLLPFFQASLPQFSTMTLMWRVGVLEVLLGAGLLLPMVSLGAVADRVVVSTAIILELLYLAAIIFVLFFSTAFVFAPTIPIVSAFGYFILYKFIAVLAALLVSAHRIPEPKT